MKRALWVCIAIFLMLLSCQQKKKPTAGGLHPKDKVHLAFALDVTKLQENNEGQLCAWLWLVNESDRPVMIHTEPDGLSYGAFTPLENSEGFEGQDRRKIGRLTEGRAIES